MHVLFFIFLTFNIFCNIVKQEIIPDVFYIGDKLIYKLTYESINNDKKIENINELSPQWGIIDNIRIVKAKEINNKQYYNISISIIPYDIGILELPELDFNKFKIKDLNIYVKNLTQENDELNYIKGVILLPSTIFFLYFSVFVLLLIIIIYLSFKNNILNKIKYIKHKNEIQHYKNSIKRRIKELNNFHKYKDKIEVHEFYYILTDILRDYFKYFFYIENYSLSISEFIKTLDKNFKNTEKNFKIFTYLLKKANQIKFSNIEITINELEKDITILKIAFDSFEKYYV